MITINGVKRPTTNKYTVIQLILSDRLITRLAVSGTPKLIISLQLYDTGKGQFYETDETTATEEAEDRATHLSND